MKIFGVPNRIRTGVTAVKGRCPRPLDDGDNVVVGRSRRYRAAPGKARGFEGRSTARQIVLYGLALIPVSLVPSILGMSGRIYLIGALLLGLYFLYSGVRVELERTILRARYVLLVSVFYLPLIYGLMLLDRPGL